MSDNSPNSSTNANSRIISPPLHESGSNSTNNENRSPVVNAGVSDPVSPQNRLVMTIRNVFLYLLMYCAYSQLSRFSFIIVGISHFKLDLLLGQVILEL